MRSTLRVRMARVLGGAALIAALLLPAGTPVAAADPVIIRVGTTQDLDTLNPYGTLLVVGYESFLLNFNMLIDFGPNLEPVPGYADTWERAADGHSWTFHIRDGMKWSDGEPATSEDACFSWQLALDALADGGVGSLGAGYLDPSLDDAKVTKVDCPDPSTMIVTTDDPSERVLQSQLPIIPKHIWGKETHTTIGDAKFEPTIVGTGPYQAVEWQTGQFVRFQRNPNYWGTQGYADEVDIIIYKTADTMVQALKAGELDYAHGPNAEQLNALKSDPNIATVVGSANGWTQLAFNTYGTGTGKTIADGGPVDAGAARPGVPRRPRLRGRPPDPRRSDPGWLRRRRDDEGAPGADPVACRADQQADVRHRARQAEAGRCRVQAERRRRPPRQGGQSDQAPADDAGLG